MVLIILGVYIAFQIDQLQASNRSETQTRVLLQGVLDNLEQDIAKADFRMEYWTENLENCKRYTDLWELRGELITFKVTNFIQTHYFLTPSLQGYTALSNNVTEIDPKIMQILSRLNVLYNDNMIIMNSYKEELLMMRKEGLTHLYHNDSTYFEFMAWDEPLREGFMKKREIFPLNDWQYRNLMAMYEYTVEMYLWEVASWRQSAYLNYIYIHDYLFEEKKLPEFIPKSEKVVSQVELDKLEGCYVRSDGSVVKISSVMDYLVYKASDHIYWLFRKVGTDHWQSVTYNVMDFHVKRTDGDNVIEIFNGRERASKIDCN